jgi:hypothetical protein
LQRARSSARADSAHHDRGVSPRAGLGTWIATDPRMRGWMLACLVVGCGSSDPGDDGVPPDETLIEIDRAQPGESRLKQGIVNGPQEYIDRTPMTDHADALLSALRPTSWRFSGINGLGYGGNIYKFVVDDYRYDTRFGTEVIVNLQDLFMARRGRPIQVSTRCPTGASNCFATFDELLAQWNADATLFLSSSLGPRITYFDPLGEPDLNSFEGLTAEQRYELLASAIRLIRQHRPAAKIVGPSNAGFNQAVYDGLVALLVRDGLRLDAISWHELGTDPRVIAPHVATMKTIFEAYPAICQPTCPEIHINEYQGEDTVFVPGHAVAWLSHLELADVDQATRACWGGDEGSPIDYESCFNGFSGMLTPDDTTPQPLYWVYKYYADLQSRFAATGAPDGIAMIAGKLDGGATGILIGNFGGTTISRLRLRVNGVSGESVRADVYRIENTFNEVVALPVVELASSVDVAPDGGLADVVIDDVGDGEAYWIVVTE